MTISSEKTRAILKKIKDVYLATPIPLHEPCIRGNAWKYVKDCLDTGWVSSRGAYVSKLEKLLAHFVGAKFAIATINGTSALHAALLVEGVKNSDEVLCPAITFVATANAITYCDAKPVFIDSDWKTLGLSPIKLKEFIGENLVKRKDGYSYNKISGNRVKACIPVHIFGHPVDIDPITELCNEYNISVIEDAAQALGSKYKGKYCGTFGKMGIFSFNGNKIVTSGGGGIIITNDYVSAQRLKHITTIAKVKDRMDSYHDEIGFNYRMPNLNAALGCAQIELLESFIKTKRELASHFHKFFREVDEVIFFVEQSWAESNYWINSLIFKSIRDKNIFIKEADTLGIEAKPVWCILSDLPMYRNCVNDGLINSREIADRVVNIPGTINKLKNMGNDS